MSILEVAGSSATEPEIVNMEGLWKRKLQSRDIGSTGTNASFAVVVTPRGGRERAGARNPVDGFTRFDETTRQ